MSNPATGNRSEQASEIDEEIHLCPYNPHWADLFASEHDHPRTALIPPAIEHIGSISVPGLHAKPVIDIMLGLSGQATQSQRQHLVSAGYEDLGEAGVPGRLYLRRRPEQSFNVHVVKRNGPLWKTNLALRNYLRADGEAKSR